MDFRAHGLPVADLFDLPAAAKEFAINPPE